LKRKEYIKAMARRLIELTMGDKLVIDDKNEKKPEEKITIENSEEGKQKRVKPPLFETFYTTYINIIYVATIIVGFIIPAILSISYTIEAGVDIYRTGKVTSFISFVEAINPILLFYIRNFWFSLIIAGTATVIVLISYAIRILIAYIEYKVLEKNIDLSSKKIQSKLKKLDDEAIERERQKNK
jgi:hypothetical protein